MLQEGNIVSAFSLRTDQGELDNVFKLNIKTVLFFFPRADTPGCTKEAIEFSSLKKDFNKLNIQLIGISKDTIVKQEKFKKKHNLTCMLGSDDNTSICENFGVWVEKSMYGKTYMGIKRTTFLIDENRKIIKIWEKVKVPNHAQEVLEFSKSL